jgi:hypothetical protein
MGVSPRTCPVGTSLMLPHTAALPLSGWQEPRAALCHILPGIGYGNDSLEGYSVNARYRASRLQISKFCGTRKLRLLSELQNCFPSRSWKGRRGNDEPIRYMDGINTRELEMGDSPKGVLFHGGEFGGRLNGIATTTVMLRRNRYE